MCLPVLSKQTLRMRIYANICEKRCTTWAEDAHISYLTGRLNSMSVDMIIINLRISFFEYFTDLDDLSSWQPVFCGSSRKASVSHIRQTSDKITKLLYHEKNICHNKSNLWWMEDFDVFWNFIPRFFVVFFKVKWNMWLISVKHSLKTQKCAAAVSHEDWKPDTDTSSRDVICRFTLRPTNCFIFLSVF